MSAIVHWNLILWAEDENVIRVGKRIIKREFQCRGDHAATAKKARQIIKRKDPEEVNITNIKLSELGLTRIPSEILDFHDALTLHLERNNLQVVRIPEGVFSCLRHFFCENNQLVVFEIGQRALQALVYMNLNNNQLTKLKISLWMFMDFKSALLLKNNNVKEFEVEENSHSCPPLLETIDLRNNKLRKLIIKKRPYGFLQRLYLQGNKDLVHFEAEDGALQNIEFLTLNVDQLKTYIAHDQVKFVVKRSNQEKSQRQKQRCIIA